MKGHATVSFALAVKSSVQLRVFDAQGKLIDQTAAMLNSGMHGLKLETENYSSGIYYISLTADNRSIGTKKLVIE